LGRVYVVPDAAAIRFWMSPRAGPCFRPIGPIRRRGGDAWHPQPGTRAPAHTYTHALVLAWLSICAIILDYQKKVAGAAPRIGVWN
jgi:hypothetical protein